MLMENDQIWRFFFFMHQTTHTICKSGHLGEYLNADVLFHLLANISKTFFLSKLFEFMLLFFITGDKMNDCIRVSEADVEGCPRDCGPFLVETTEKTFVFAVEAAELDDWIQKTV